MSLDENESWYASLEKHFTWAYVECQNAWFHGNGRMRIDKTLDRYFVSFRRAGRDGYGWDATWSCSSLEDAKEMAETAFPLRKV